MKTVAAAAAEEEWGKMINLSRLKSLSSTFNSNHSKKKEPKRSENVKTDIQILSLASPTATTTKKF